MDDLNLRGRVISYCEAKKISLNAFEKKAGLSRGYFRQVKKWPSDDKIKSIKRAFPDLNTDWLRTGDGEMFVSAHNVSSGDYSPNITGGHNALHYDSELLRDALAEITATRELLQEQMRTSTEQTNRLLTIIEQLSK